MVNPEKIWRNTGSKPGDYIFITKKLGVSLVAGAYLQNEASKESYEEAVKSMISLNKYSGEALKEFNPSSVTDVTGFGLLGHLNEMIGNHGARIYSSMIPEIPGALDAAKKFLFTAGGQRNRNYLKNVKFEIDDFAMEELLFDPQTSGGLLFTLDREKGEQVMRRFREKNLFLKRIGEIEEEGGIRVV